ncbi:MAG: helix-turn-helix transcriptional regulator [Ruminiclostridium sp.]|jgi:two-component system response regulator YesN|nr:helix-turn-helix transcriptional regulator [Ruminiclostridium sp.]
MMELVQKQNIRPYIDFFFLDRKDLILNSFRYGNMHHYKNTIQEFFNLLDVVQNFTIEDTKKIVVEFSLVINNIAFHLGTSVEHELARYSSSSYGDYDVTHNHVEWLKKFITAIFDALYNKLYMNRQDKNKEQVYWIKSYIDSHLDENISLSYFEDTCFLCKEYLLKLFKNEFGYTIYEYVLKMRMERARELLVSSDTEIKEITNQVGYNDTNYFCKAFKRYFGISPSKFRKFHTA